MGRKIVLTVIVSLLTFAAVWGTYISVLSAGMRSSGDPPYALAVGIAVTVQFVIYKIVRLFMKGVQRWLACTVIVLVPILIVTVVFKGGDNYKMLGAGFNGYLLGGMLGFSFLACIRLLADKLMPERVRPDFLDKYADEPDVSDEDNNVNKAEDAAQK